MTLNMSVFVFNVNGATIGVQDLNLPSLNVFEQRYLNGGDSIISKAYAECHPIIVRSPSTGNVLGAYKRTPSLELGKYDRHAVGLEMDILRKTRKVLLALLTHGDVTVSFDYEGRTRHETAGNQLLNELRSLTVAPIQCDIDGYKCRFELTDFNKFWEQVK